MTETIRTLIASIREHLDKVESHVREEEYCDTNVPAAALTMDLNRMDDALQEIVDELNAEEVFE